jgi:hypothetical protein
MDRKEEQIRLLAMLDGCPEGAPEKLLTVGHNSPPALLYACVEKGLIRAEMQMVGSRTNSSVKTTIFRFHITEYGRSYKRNGG